MTYTDKNGNTYRNQGGEWQVLKQGIGWSSFSCPVDIGLKDGTIIPAQVSQKDLPKFSEAEKSILISHVRDVHLQISASELANPTGDKVEALIDGIAESAADLASSLIRELRGAGAFGCNN